MNNDNLLAENALTDAQEVARGLDRKFTDEDVRNGEYGDLFLAARHYVLTSTLDKSNGFVRSLKVTLAIPRDLSIAQARGALNVMRHEMGVNGKTAPVHDEDGNENPVERLLNDDRELRMYDCHKCGASLAGITALRNHKKSAHVDVAPALDGDGVIASRESTLGLDLSEIPNGYYALPDTSGRAAFIFLRVSRTKRDKRRDRRYRFGKIITGNEMVPMGTLEVQEWSSDSKRLCGEQRPKDVYRGEFEAVMPILLANPRAWAIVFGTQIGRCGRCGKTLTDDDSRGRGIGPECIKHDGTYWSSFGKSAVTRY